MSNDKSGLENAPAHVKLAVDLIQLLEENQLSPQTVIPALEIVLQDYKNKAQTQSAPDNSSYQ